MRNHHVLTNEQLAKFTTVAIHGFVSAITNIPMHKDRIKPLYEATLSSIQEGGFVEELIEVYDNDLFDKLVEEFKKLDEEEG